MNKVEQLKKCLQKARKELNDKGYKYIPGESRLMDCKPFEVAYQDCIEKIWPEEPWWKVTNYWDIFDAMMGGLSDEEVIDEICKHVDSEFLKEDAENAKVEEHSYEEYMKKFGVAYKEGELWDFSEEDFKDGAVEINPEMTYWKIEVDGEPRYFETPIENSEEALHKCSKKLDEGTSNFGHLEYFPLLVFYTYDEVFDMMRYDSDNPEEAEFEDEDGNVDYDAYEEAREAFEQKFWDNLDCCVLDEDEVERLEDKLFDFNQETKNIAYDLDTNEDGYQEYGPNINLDDVELEIEAGYYEAAYIDVKNERSLDYCDEKVKEEQIARINNFMKELKKEFGLSEYKIAWGPASNGETGYQKVKDESLKEVEENMYDGKKGGNKGSVKTKVHVNKNAGNPKRNMEIFNHMMGTGPEVSTGVSLGESEKGKVEFCLMSDGDNVDCYASEEEAIKSAEEFYNEVKNRKLNKNIRVLKVTYGPENEVGDAEEQDLECVWDSGDIDGHYYESLKEGKEKNISYGIVYILHNDADERGEMFDTEEEAKEFAKTIDKEKYNGYRIMKIESHEENGETIYDDEIVVDSEAFDESLKEEKENCNAHMTFYIEDFDNDVWEEYGKIAGIGRPLSCSEFTVFFNTKNKKGFDSHITLFADEFDADVWKEYCDIAEVSPSKDTLDIYFNKKDVEVDKNKKESLKEDIDEYDPDFDICCKDVAKGLEAGWWHGMTSSERSWGLTVNGGDGNQFCPSFADVIAHECSYPVSDGNFSYAGLDCNITKSSFDLDVINFEDESDRQMIKTDLLAVGCEESEIDAWLANADKSAEIEFFIDYDIDIDDLEESDEEEYLSDKVTKVLDDYGILYGDIVENGNGTVNIVGVDEEEWDEVVEAIKAELGLDVLVPDEDHGEFDDELIVTESHHKSKKYKIIYEDDFITNDDGSIRLFSKEEAREFLDSVDINDRNNYDVVEESLKGEKLAEEKSESSLVKKIKESIKAFLESNGWESDDIELFVIEEEPFVDGEGNKANHIQIRNDLIGFYRAVDLGLIDNLDEIVDPGYFEPYSRFVWDAYIWEGEGE